MMRSAAAPGNAQAPNPWVFAASGRVMNQALALPFDTMRTLYARGVQAGLIERSMLANARFEHALGSLERTLLGPWARRV